MLISDRRLLASAAAVLLLASQATGAEPQLPLAWRPVAREILAELVQLDTSHEKGSTEAAQAIARRLRAAGYPEDDLTLAGPLPHKQNLVVRVHGTGSSKPVLYILHLDVVAARREDWSRDPFALTEADGFFYGRGTSDMKGDVATLVTTLIRLRQEGYQPDRDLIVAFTDDEEGDHPDTNGARWLLANRPQLIAAAFVIDPEDGGGELRRGRRMLLDFQTSEKVYLSFQLQATDPGGHSSAPHPGNPIFRLAGALTRIGAFQFPVRLNPTTRGYFAAMAGQETGTLAADLAALGRQPTSLAAAARVARVNDAFGALMHTTCTATELSGGHAQNALPQLARATLNCRLLPEDSADAVEATLRRLIADPAVAVTRLNVPTPSPPAALAPEVVEPATRVMRAMFPGVRLTPVLSNGASDALYFRAAGIPAYGVSGLFYDVDDNRAHGRDERLGVAEFYDGVEFAYRFIKELTTPAP